MPEETQLKPSTELPNTLTWEDVPIDVFRNLGVEISTIPSKEVSKIREIYEWAKTKCDEPTVGNILVRINSLENQLGSPALNENRWDKTWRFIKLQRQVDDLQKRQETLRKRWM